MTNQVEIIMGLFIITSLLLLGSSRLLGCIRLVAVQGVLLGLLPLFIYDGGWVAHRIFLSFAILVLKGVVFPLFLMRAIRERHGELTETRGGCALRDKASWVASLGACSRGEVEEGVA